MWSVRPPLAMSIRVQPREPCEISAGWVTQLVLPFDPPDGAYDKRSMAAPRFHPRSLATAFISEART